VETVTHCPTVVPVAVTAAERMHQQKLKHADGDSLANALRQALLAAECCLLMLKRSL